MGFSLFNRNVELGRVQESIGATPIYSALMDGLSEMERMGVDRLVLALYDSKPDDSVRGRWISPEESCYYPFELLADSEQEIIRDHKHYTIISLVRANVGGVRTYPARGLEIFHRTAVNPFLPRLKPESSLRYVTRDEGYVGEEDLKRYLEESEAVDAWTPTAIEQAVNAGIQEYQTTTKRLMEDAGVHDSLENMEQRQYTPFEQIMVNMRRGINKAINKK
ncbi:hypothetical protein HY500_04550 [Candidatus Woesearchaeota archaeon]|nr:hypothetical protein [Candidatus Woesearchaeota archaeon]